MNFACATRSTLYKICEGPKEINWSIFNSSNVKLQHRPINEDNHVFSLHDDVFMKKIEQDYKPPLSCIFNLYCSFWSNRYVYELLCLICYSNHQRASDADRCDDDQYDMIEHYQYPYAQIPIITNFRNDTLEKMQMHIWNYHLVEFGDNVAHEQYRDKLILRPNLTVIKIEAPNPLVYIFGNVQFVNTDDGEDLKDTIEREHDSAPHFCCFCGDEYLISPTTENITAHLKNCRYLARLRKTNT